MLPFSGHPDFGSPDVALPHPIKFVADVEQGLGGRFCAQIQ